MMLEKQKLQQCLYFVITMFISDVEGIESKLESFEHEDQMKILIIS